VARALVRPLGIATLALMVNLGAPTAAPAAIAPDAAGRAELRCGAAQAADNADFTLFLGVAGFAPNTLVRYTLFPEDFPLGGSTTDAQGSFGWTGFSSVYAEGFIGSPFSSSPFTLAPGQHSVTYTNDPGDTATVSFNVPGTCPPFQLDVQPSQTINQVHRNAPFTVALLSSPGIDLTSRTDLTSLQAALDDQTPLPLNFQRSVDLNGDGLLDLQFRSVISIPRSQLEPGFFTLRLTGRTTDEGTSPNGFLFIRNDTFELVN